ncbi:hypothetical protein D3C86_1134130 [compost metagenome]
MAAGLLLVALHVLAVALGARDGREHRAGRIGLVVEAEAREAVLDDRQLLGIVVDHEVPAVAIAQELDVLAQDPRADRVEGPDPHAVRLDVIRLQEHIQALLELLGGLVGEGDGQDLVGAGVARAQKVGDAVSQDAGLAGASPREDQQRALDVLDSRLLNRIEGGHGFSLLPLDGRESTVLFSRDKSLVYGLYAPESSF